ncbi:HAD family hydrolase [Ruminococcus sp. OA3]|uniref:HAD family hydrolase n=1 Tax=Ruminococcus sp. OA3 TaxID=2914164 RepID=UPI001F06F0F7|nr:HAD family hydrolase [Ruminococcus sp. OA3]MCH1984114.1 HAD family hydrolase [Ruminococcus sp. OA3]
MNRGAKGRVMIKAVFIDYTGTTVKEDGEEIRDVVKRVCHNSDLHDPQAVLALWWKRMKQYEENSYGENYLTEDEIVDKILQSLVVEIHLKENLRELHVLIRRSWVCAPAFPDAKEFFEKCPVPIYMISNNGIEYVKKGMEDKQLQPEAIICADMVRAYKPHRELFERALEVSGCGADEVLHIGDSYSSDVLGARAAAIQPVLVQRTKGKTYDDVMTVQDLSEVLHLLDWGEAI